MEAEPAVAIKRAFGGSRPVNPDIAGGTETGWALVMIQRAWREGVGKVPPAKRGAGPTKYYLRAYADSDST
jgi:hypothetical protein